MTADTQYRRFGAQLLIIPALALLLLLAAGCSEKETTPPQGVTPAQAPELTAAPQAAAGAVNKPAGTQTASADGQKIFQASCQACHIAGVAGAPKAGDKAAWAPRIAKGNDALFSSVKNGLNAMPPKGTCMSCSDDELRSAVAYMVEQGS